MAAKSTPVTAVAGGTPITAAPQAGMGAPSATQPTASAVPCDAAAIISTRCTGCHQAEPKFGAPMPLMSAADFRAPAKSNAARKVADVTVERIDPTDPSRRMPPTSLPALTQSEKQTLKAWLQGGAMGVADGCAITTSDILADPTAGSNAEDTNPGAVATPHSGGASVTPIEYDDPEMKCYKFTSHAPNDMNKPYTQGPGETYTNFTFKAPWQGTVYSRAIKLAIDPNSKVIHHWLLFKLTGPTTDGGIQTGASGAHPDGILLHGWAPGASPMYLDPDVGMKLESDVGYLLEVHFNNSTGAPGDDMSGAEVCVTPRVPEHVAELSWLGTDSITGTSAQGTCRPVSQEPIRIIAAQPHMHLKGTHMKVVINRSDGSQELVHDEDFSFENQRYYIFDHTVMPGDTLTTSCTYNAPATFGQSTNNEMCYFFTMHWPAGALRSAGIGTVIHGANSCM